MQEEKTSIPQDEEEIYFDSSWELKRVYDYRPYTFYRIQRILRQDFGCRLENIWQGYKANRRANYCELYQVVRIHDNQVIVERTSLYALRRFLAQQDYPLEDKKSMSKCPKRNQDAETFLSIVKQLNN